MDRKRKIEKALNNGTFDELEFNNEDKTLFEIFKESLKLENFKNCALITPKLYKYEPPHVIFEEGVSTRIETLESINRRKRAENNRGQIQDLLNKKIKSLISKGSFSSLFRLINEFRGFTFFIDDSIIYATKLLLKKGDLQQIINFFMLLNHQENWFSETIYYRSIIYGIEKNKDQFLNAIFSMYINKLKWDVDNGISVDTDNEMLKFLWEHNKSLWIRMMKMYVNSEDPEYLLIGFDFMHNMIFEEEREKIKIQERNRIMANLSHTVKTMLSNVIDPLQNMKETRIVKPIKIDNALRGAELIKSLVNAMNLSFKGSIEDFIYDVQNNTYDNSSSMEEMFIDSLKQAISTTFDGKYFKKFVDNFYPSKAKFLEVKQKWNDISQFNDMEKIIEFLNKYLIKTTLDISKAKEYVIGDDKGSALKFLILIQEIILNAVKYSSFVSKESRNLHIIFEANKKDISIIVSNTFKQNVQVKSSGLGQEIIKNFSTLLQTEPIINTDNNLYSVEIKFENVWRTQK